LKRLISMVFFLGLACARPSLEPEPAPEPAPEVSASAQPVAAAPRVVESLLRYRGGDSGPEFSNWSQGQVLSLGVDLANLRSSPQAEAPVVATLPMGAPMEILEVSSEPVTVLERTNRWYRVRSGKSEGHVFGSLLTPLALKADLDGDGGEEWLSVTFGPDFAPRVRVMEPELPEDQDRMVGLDLKFPDFAQGGTASIELRVPEVDAWNLLQVKLCEGTRCAVRLVSYLREEGKALGQLAELRGDASALSFVPGGIVLGGKTYLAIAGKFTSDAPPQDCVFPFVPGGGGDSVDVTLQEVERGPYTDVSCEPIGTLQAPDYRGQDVMSCAIRQSGKGGPNERYLIRFVRTSAKHWTRLAKLSSDEPWAQQLLATALEAEGITTEGDHCTTARGMDMPEVLLEGPWGKLRRQHFSDEEGAPSTTLSVDWSHGALYGNRQGDGAVYLPQPEGTYAVYNYELKELVPGGQYSVRDNHCLGDTERYAQVLDIPDAELKLFTTTPDGQQLYTILDPEHPYHQQFDAKIEVPYLLWKDPFGRMVELLRAGLHPPEMCEPVLYFYGTDEPVTVTLDPEIVVTASSPRIRDHRWTVLPTGDGGVRQGERTWPFLFWEGEHGLFDPPSSGEVVAQDEVEAYLRRVLPAHGLQGREIDDFVRIWAPKLEQSPFVRISFHERALIDEVAPMTIEPPPDTLVRVMMEYEPLQRAVPSVPSPAPVPPPRRGFTVVEWGGVIR
jgi:hypothetical protein